VCDVGYLVKRQLEYVMDIWLESMVMIDNKMVHS